MDARLAGIALLALMGARASFAGPDQSNRMTGLQHLQRYAFSACLAKGFASVESVALDAASAARAYLEEGNLPLEAHTAATRLAIEFLSRNYNSATGQRLVVMKCLDMMHSRELKAIATRYSTAR